MSAGAPSDAAPGDTTGSGAAVAAAARLLGERAERSVSLRSFTTFRIGGPAALFVRAHTMSDLELVADAAKETGLPVLTIGQGSNLLIADAGVPGIVLHLEGEFEEVRFEEQRSTSTMVGDRAGVAVAGGAVKLPVLARRAAAAGWQGVGWMVGVPGSVGGAVRMNAGGHGSDVAANLLSARVFSFDAPKTTRLATVAPEELTLRYRSSALTDRQVVVDARFAVVGAEPKALEDELSEIVRWRRAHQPGGANCGSVFTNPPGDSAGRLIDHAGLRGFRLGSASVSEKHANFIQADENASASDVWALIVHVRAVVFERFGIDLHPEVRTAGFDATLPDLQPNP